MYSGTRMGELHRSQVCYSGSYMYMPKHTQKRHTLFLPAPPYYLPYTVNVYLSRTLVCFIDFRMKINMSHTDDSTVSGQYTTQN